MVAKYLSACERSYFVFLENALDCCIQVTIRNPWDLMETLEKTAFCYFFAKSVFLYFYPQYPPNGNHTIF